MGTAGTNTNNAPSSGPPSEQGGPVQSIPSSTEKPGIVGCCDERESEQHQQQQQQQQQHPPEMMTSKSIIVELIRLGIPNSASYALWLVSKAMTMAFVGHQLGKDDMAVYAVAMAVYNVTGASIPQGVVAALDTLASQAYGRTKEGKEFGILIQRSLVVSAVLIGLISIFFFSCEPLMVICFGDHLGAGTAQVLRMCVPLLVAHTLQSTFLRVLQSHKVPQMITYGIIVSTISCPIFNILLTHRGMWGAITALTLMNYVSVAMFVTFSFYHPTITIKNASWSHPEWQKILDRKLLREYLSIGRDTTLAVCAEWWVLELIQVAVARTGSLVEVDLLNIALTVTALFFSILSGFKSAGTVCVGNALGANDPAKAKRYFTFTLMLAGMSCCVTVPFLSLGGASVIAKLFTKDEELISRFASFNFICGLFHLGDTVQFTAQGLFRGAGKQAYAATIVMCSLWLIGMPLVFFLCLKQNMGAKGAMVGLMVAFAFEVPALLWHEQTQWNWVEMAAVASKPRTVDDSTDAVDGEDCIVITTTDANESDQEGSGDEQELHSMVSSRTAS